MRSGNLIMILLSLVMAASLVAVTLKGYYTKPLMSLPGYALVWSIVFHKTRTMVTDVNIIFMLATLFPKFIIFTVFLDFILLILYATLVVVSHLVLKISDDVRFAITTIFLLASSYELIKITSFILFKCGMKALKKSVFIIDIEGIYVINNIFTHESINGDKSTIHYSALLNYVMVEGFMLSKNYSCTCPECCPILEYRTVLGEEEVLVRRNTEEGFYVINFLSNNTSKRFPVENFHRKFSLGSQGETITASFNNGLLLWPSQKMDLTFDKDWDSKLFTASRFVTYSKEKDKITLLTKSEKYVFISHIWEQESNPDPLNQTIRHSLLNNDVIWIDFMSLPQRIYMGQLTGQIFEIFKEELLNMYTIQENAIKTVKVIPSWAEEEYDHRGWCVAEQVFMGNTKMINLLYHYCSIYGFNQEGFSKSLRSLRISLSNMGDATAIMKYFPKLKGGYQLSELFDREFKSCIVRLSNSCLKAILKDQRHHKYPAPHNFLKKSNSGTNHEQTLNGALPKHLTRTKQISSIRESLTKKTKPVVLGIFKKEDDYKNLVILTKRMQSYESHTEKKRIIFKGRRLTGMNPIQKDFLSEILQFHSVEYLIRRHELWMFYWYYWYKKIRMIKC